ncbi:MAG: T9SS type A sorting domain-containing protein, partial [Crocinitomicaceae bacterium]|nr:T9SS type A sorting domain-containing protein [Crocinitomicaceae bacterium]
VQIYPNPSAGQLYIETELPFENAQLSDATGRTIQSFDLHAGVNEMRFPSLQSGTYFIRMGEQCVKWVVE